MKLKHKIVINVSDTNGKKATVLKGAVMKLPSRIVKFLFGGYTQVYLLAPGQTVDSVDVKEMKKEELQYE